MCDCDDYFPEFQRTSIPKARKQHKCCECRQPIKVGELYFYSVAKWDGEIDTVKQCLACSELMEKTATFLNCCVCYGELKSTLIDNELISYDKKLGQWQVDPNVDFIQMDESDFPRPIIPKLISFCKILNYHLRKTDIFFSQIQIDW